MAETLPYYLEKPDAAPEPVGGLKEFAGSVVGPSPQQIVQMAPPPPSQADLTAARDKASAAREGATRRASDFAAAMEPQIAAAKTAATTYAAETDAASKKAQQAQEQVNAIPKPPSRGLRPFLASSKDDPPENTIAKLTQAITLAATMLGGGKNGARASLSALTGALEGWREGDRWRADRAYADWKAQTDLILEQADREMQTYEIAMKAAGVPLEQRMKMIDLSARNFDNHALADKMKVGDLDASAKALEAQRAAFVDLQKWAAETDAKKQVSDNKHELAIQKLEQAGDYQRALITLKTQQEGQRRERDAEVLNQYTSNPDALRALGQQWFLDKDGKMPVGAPRGKIGEQVRPMIVQAGLEWARANGIDPMSAPSVRAEIAAARGAQNKLAGVNAIQQAAIRRLDGHLDALVTLSDKVPRTEMPAINAAILRGQRDFQGSPEAAQYVFQSFEVAMELARVMVGTAQGDANTREEARQQIAAAFNPTQIKAVVGQLRANAHRNLESNKESERANLAVIEKLQGVQSPQAPKSDAGGRAASRTDVESAIKESAGDTTKARALLIQRGFDPSKELAK